MLLRRYKEHQVKKPDVNKEKKENEKVQEVEQIESEEPKKRNTRKKSE